MRRLLVPACLLCLVILLGCGPADDGSPSPTERQTELPIPSVTLSLSSKLTNLDIVGSTHQPSIVTLYLIAGRLFRLNHDWSVEPELAESMEVSGDGLTVTVTLKEGLVYSDGTPVTSRDVVFAYTRNRDHPGPFFPMLLAPVRQVEAPDSKTVVFHLKEPYLDLPLALAHMAMGIHPRSRIEEDPEYFHHPVSSGPYVLKEWIPGASKWTIEANPNYVRGRMAIERIELVAVPDPTSRVLQLTAGTIDYVYDLPVTARTSLPAEVETYPAPHNGQYHVAFNGGLPDGHPLRNAQVRQAISLAIDRDEVNQKAFGGISAPARGFQYAGPPESLFNLPYGGKRNLAAARELLAETPFRDGFSVKLQAWGQRSGWTDAALVIAANLEELGIQVQVEPLEDAVASSNLRSGSYEMQFSGLAAGPMNFFRSQWIPGATWTESLRYHNPEVIRLVNSASVAIDFDRRIELIHRAQELALQDMPLVPISERVVLVGSRIDRKILFEANLPPGTNPMVATLAELQRDSEPASTGE